MTNYSALHYSEKARKAAVGTIEEYPAGSARYWADQAQAIVNIPDASESQKGLARLATQTEATAGTDDTSIMTPKKVASITDVMKEDIDDVAQYAKDLKERVDEIELFKFPNATIIGTPTINNGQISDFSADSYLQFPFELDLTNRRLRTEFEFTTGSNITTQQNVLDSQFGIALAIANGKGLMAVSSNGTSWNIGQSVGTIDIQPNTTYRARMTWDGLQYKTFLSTNGIDYVQDMTLVSNQRPYPRTIFIGGCSGSVIGHEPHPFLGTINLNRAFLYMNDVLIWQGMDDAGLASRANVSLDNLDHLGQAKFDAKMDASTKYGASLEYLNGSLQLKDQEGNNLGSSVIIKSGGASTLAVVNIPAEAWSEDSKSATVAVEGVTTGSDIDMGLPIPTTYDNASKVASAALVITGLGEGTVTFTCREVPQNNLEVTIRIWED